MGGRRLVKRVIKVEVSGRRHWMTEAWEDGWREEVIVGQKRQYRGRARRTNDWREWIMIVKASIRCGPEELSRP